MTDFDTAVKLSIYETVAATGRLPDAAGVARQLGAAEADVLAAFARLHGRRLLVPEPGDPARIRMAPPFSGAPTLFRVQASGIDYDANCVWDAFGVAAALRADADVDSQDAHTGEPLRLLVRDGRPVPAAAVAHFAVPAAHWWDDILFT
jgi:hypothetical protein